MSARGDLRKVARAALKRGWVEIPMGNKTVHRILQWHNGDRITVSATPSCCHAVANFQADMRRVERKTLP